MNKIGEHCIAGRILQFLASLYLLKLKENKGFTLSVSRMRYLYALAVRLETASKRKATICVCQ